MKGARRLVPCALMVATLAGVGQAPPASAQFYDAARRSITFSDEATLRAPRLLGMGRLALLDDANNRIDLWDFAGNPLGVLDADSSSTFELRPSTASAAGYWHPIGTARERQYLAGRELRLDYEAWRRTDSTAAYGFYGDVATLRTDRPFDDGTAIRARLDEPRVAGVLNGRMPFFQSDRMGYVLEAYYATERTADQYRTLFSNASGDYLGRGGDMIPPPELFTPDEYEISSLGGNGGLSYRLGPWLTAALVGGGSSNRIEGDNSSLIHTSGTGEDRSYYTGQGSLVGALGGLEYGADGRVWTASSEERWVFTLKAGINQAPFAGRGKKLDRDENGNEGRARARYRIGNLELNAAASRWSREIEIDTPFAPDSADYDFSDAADRQRYADDLVAYQLSFNYFRNLAANREGADSLALPDSVTAGRSEERAWNLGYGAAWRLPGGRGLLGVEYHLAVAELEQTLSGLGPRRRVWDVRSGFEYAWTPAFRGRVGYVYRSDDVDEYQDLNELRSHTVTLGFGLVPTGVWSIEAGWAMEWIRPVDEDPSEPKESRQQIAAQIRWAF